MEIQCQCGQFKAEIKNFPVNTPGRLGCYCDDCQSYLIHLNRTDLLDQAGCTEVVPIYPQDMSILQGTEYLRCTQLTPKGTFRWSTTCCNSPIANTLRKTPWVGLYFSVFDHYTKIQAHENILGSVKSRIMGRFAKGSPKEGTPEKMGLKAIFCVLPFLLKGKLLKKQSPSPFFKEDGSTPIISPVILSEAERIQLREKYKNIPHYG